MVILKDNIRNLIFSTFMIFIEKIKRYSELTARWCYQFVRPKPFYYHRVKQRGVEPAPKGQPRLIVSLTSFPARIKTVSYTIESLLTQTKKTDMVVLWLGYDKFPGKEKDLPKRLLRLEKYGLIIKWCKDIRSYTKLIPSLEAFPEDIIVTVDDDVWYPPQWLEKLYNSYLKNPELIHAHRCLQVTTTNGEINKYIDWGFQIYAPQEPSYCWHITGTGGVLYPPHCFHKDICDREKFLSMAPTVDDIWFWAMAILNHTRFKIVDGNIFDFEGVFIVNNKALWTANAFDKNDEAIQKIAEFYPKFLELLKNDLSK